MDPLNEKLSEIRASVETLTQLPAYRMAPKVPGLVLDLLNLVGEMIQTINELREEVNNAEARYRND